MTPSRSDIAQATREAARYALDEVDALLVCVRATIEALIDMASAGATMDKPAVLRLVDALVVLDTAMDVVRERLDERREAVEAIADGRIPADAVRFLVRPPRQPSPPSGRNTGRQPKVRS